MLFPQVFLGRILQHNTKLDVKVAQKMLFAHKMGLTS